MSDHASLDVNAAILRDTLHGNPLALAALDALVAERDEARRELDFKKKALRNCREAHLAAEAEVARLREALTVYAGRTNDYEVARAALGEDA